MISFYGYLGYNAFIILVMAYIPSHVHSHALWLNSKENYLFLLLFSKRDLFLFSTNKILLN